MSREPFSKLQDKEVDLGTTEEDVANAGLVESRGALFGLFCLKAGGGYAVIFRVARAFFLKPKANARKGGARRGLYSGSSQN